MTIDPKIAAAAVLAACVLAATVSARRCLNAKEAADTAIEAKQSVERNAATILALRQQKARVELRERPKQDVIAQVNAVLAEAGIGSDRFQGLEREGDEAVGDITSATRTRRQSLRLTLDRLSPTDLGAFLGKWRAAQPAWAVSRIELLHDKKDVTDANRFTVHLLLASTYIPDGFPGGAK
jgi:hypothetical protein